MSRVLLYGSDGNTPLAVDRDEADGLKGLLLACFGGLQGMKPGRMLNPQDLSQYRHALAAGIVKALGQRTIENHYGIELEIAQHEKLPTQTPEPDGIH
jgi:hypothetical protein